MKYINIKNLLLLFCLAVLIACSSTNNNDVAPDNTNTDTDASRTDANYQGMIVGSTGHFFATIKEKLKQITVTLDDNKIVLKLTKEETVGSGKEYTFESDDKKNKIVVLIDTKGPSVKELVLDGHPDAEAEITDIDDSKPLREKPLIFEGYTTLYAVKVPEGSNDVQPTDDNKIELYKMHSNIVIKGNKLVELGKVRNSIKHLEKLKSTLGIKSISLNDEFVDELKMDKAKKRILTIKERTDDKIVITRPPDSPEGQSVDVTYTFTKVGGKLQIKLPMVQAPIEGPKLKDKTKEKTDVIKPLHHLVDGKYYKLKNIVKELHYRYLKQQAELSGASQTNRDAPNNFLKNTENAEEVTQAEATHKDYPTIHVKLFVETEFNEVK